MKLLKLFSYFLCAYFVILGIGISNTSGTPESITIANLRLVMELFVQVNGVPPTNWHQFEQFFSLQKINEERLKGTDVYPLQEHYVFVTQKISMLGYEEGELFLIRATPLTNSLTRNAGRYVISQDDQGGFKFAWLKEEKVQQMLAKAGVTELPKPEPWVPRTNNATQSPEPQSSNLLPGTSPSTKIQSSADFSNGTSKANLQTNAEPVPIAQTTFSQTWKVIAVAAFILLLLGWLISRRKRKL